MVTYKVVSSAVIFGMVSLTPLSMTTSRRNFLRMGTTALGGIALHAHGSVPSADGPMVISTWNFGLQANEAAWKILNAGGRALDAIEAGARVPESDPNNTTVGLGGAPDREGRVTLDACIMDEKGGCGSVVFLEDKIGRAHV